MAELLAGVKIQLKSGEQVDAGDYLKEKRFYEAVKEYHPEFEIVFVSRDKNADDLFEYFNEHMGDWTFIPFGDPKIEELLEMYEARSIPGLRIIRPDGTVVVNDARTEIQEKAAGNPQALFEEWEAFYV